MKKVLSQLRGAGGSQGATGRVDVWKVLLDVRSRCADRAPVPEVGSEALPAWINMDRNALASVLTHVIRNAQDATPENGQISIQLHRADGWLTVSVVDSGHGMDAEFIRERLFRPFDSTKGTQGMGIGAYQVRDLVRGAGGEVDVESVPGVGTTFRLTFPCAADQAGSDHPPEAADGLEAAATESAPTTGAGMT
jgi:signal transduction histidine kinase